MKSESPNSTLCVFLHYKGEDLTLKEGNTYDIFYTIGGPNMIRELQVKLVNDTLNWQFPEDLYDISEGK